jgi:hypothetical protein
VSVSTRRNQAAASSNGLRWRMAQASAPVGSLAQQAAPLARSAGTTVRQGTETVIVRATPMIEAARSWAAPQLESSAHAISDTIAPRISDALIVAAHKIDVPRRKSRKRGGMVAGAIALTAAAGAAAVAVVRLRRQSDGLARGDAADLGSDAGTDTAVGPESGPDADMNGHSRII